MTSNSLAEADQALGLDSPSIYDGLGFRVDLWGLPPAFEFLLLFSPTVVGFPPTFEFSLTLVSTGGEAEVCLLPSEAGSDPTSSSVVSGALEVEDLGFARRPSLGRSASMTSGSVFLQTFRSRQ